MGFENAIRELKSGNKVKRTGWEGNVKYVVMDIIALTPGENDERYLKCVDYSGAQYGWCPSMFDVLAEDWEVIQC